MLSDFFTVLLCIVFAVLFVTVQLYLSKRLAPKIKHYIKDMPYECGEVPQGGAHAPFNSRYYVFALAFLIFDVEMVFMFPVACVFRDWVDMGWGGFALFEILLFMSILFFGLVFLWRNGDLQWAEPSGEKNISDDTSR